MATLAAVQSSCAFASPDPLDQAIQRELAAFGPCSRPSFSLPLAGRVVWARACETASGSPHRGPASDGAGAASAATRRTASATFSGHVLCNLG